VERLIGDLVFSRGGARLMEASCARSAGRDTTHVGVATANVGARSDPLNISEIQEHRLACCPRRWMIWGSGRVGPVCGHGGGHQEASHRDEPIPPMPAGGALGDPPPNRRRHPAFVVTFVRKLGVCELVKIAFVMPAR
jgi:hypothetical protein